MNDAIQQKLDAQIAKGNTPQKAVRIVEVANEPILSEELLEKDKRQTDLMEVNFLHQSARVVEASEAPELTPEVFEDEEFRKHIKPIKTVEVFFDGVDATVEVRDGGTLFLQIKEGLLRAGYQERIESAEDTDKKIALLREMDTKIKQLTIAETITKPVFSYDGKGKGYPIEDRSPVGINTLYEACLLVRNNPALDKVFQVECLRGTPFEAALMLQSGLELYPLGTQKKKTADLSDDEIQQIENANREQRQILVSSLMPAVNLSYNGVGRKQAYPVENLSDRCLDTLHNAYKVSNTPEGRLKSLRMFPAVGGNGDRKGAVPESLSDDGGQSDAV